MTSIFKKKFVLNNRFLWVQDLPTANIQTDNISDIFTVQVVTPGHITLPRTSPGKSPKEGSTVQLLIFT